MNERLSNLEAQKATMSGWGMTEKKTHPRLLSETSNMIAGDDSNQWGMSVLRITNTKATGICDGDSGGNALISY